MTTLLAGAAHRLRTQIAHQCGLWTPPISFCLSLPHFRSRDFDHMVHFQKWFLRDLAAIDAMAKVCERTDSMVSTLQHDAQKQS